MRPKLLRGCAALFLAATAIGGCHAATVDPNAPPAGVNLVPTFCEEFNGDHLDTSRWANAFKMPTAVPKTILDRNLWGNQELEVYFDRNFLGLGIDPFSVSGGALTISARPLDATALAKVRATVNALPAAFRNTTLSKVAYSSGMISNESNFGQQYGYFAMRARWTGGRGVWPGFWMLPNDDSWPPELDILEALGDRPTTLYQSTHSSVAPLNMTKIVAVQNEQNAYHTYGALWTPTTIDYYVDGVKTASTATPKDMTKKMHLIVTLTMGGAWPGSPDATTVWPAKLTIDWIRAWRFPTASEGNGSKVAKPATCTNS